MSSEENSKPHRVLALKYRPRHFDELIGQDALVQTLKNAITTGRLANAYMLTGVRGVGKTTTARIIAKALNYAGPDGKGEPTTGNTDDCPICRAITEDRHPDVIEMDAASRTGIDDIREILDGVRYAPTEARYKVYIIDEIHMLSKQAFNALLKTLEEPPSHVKFIFATTEIRKVPVTVLSRCQRFDLRRLDVASLKQHFAGICEKEGAEISDEALDLIARAADGSVRDGLSILDQAMALADEEINAELVQSMLGLSDKSKIITLLERGLSGETPQALDILDEFYNLGADPIAVIKDALEIISVLTRIRAVGAHNAALFTMSQDQFALCKALAEKLSMPTLGKSWQIFLKGLEEAQKAPNPQTALEMTLLRLSYAADLPDPGDLIRRLEKDGVVSGVSQAAAPKAQAAAQKETVTAHHSSGSSGAQRQGLAVQPRAEMEAETQEEREQQRAVFTTLLELRDCLEQAGYMVLASHLYHYARFVGFKTRGNSKQVVLKSHPDAPSSFSTDLRTALQEMTGEHWLVVFDDEARQVQPTLHEQQEQKQADKIEAISQNPLIQKIRKHFPEATITDIKEL